MKEEIEKRRAEAAEKKKQLEEEATKPAFTVSPKGSSKVSFGAKVQTQSCFRGFPHLPLVVCSQVLRYPSLVFAPQYKMDFCLWCSFNVSVQKCPSKFG